MVTSSVDNWCLCMHCTVCLVRSLCYSFLVLFQTIIFLIVCQLRILPVLVELSDCLLVFLVDQLGVTVLV